VFLLTYLRRELQHRVGEAGLIVAGLGAGVGLAIAITSTSAAVSNAQAAVLAGLAGIGTDITVSANAPANPSGADSAGAAGTLGPAEARKSTVIASAGLLEASTVDAISRLRHVAAVGDSLTLTQIIPPRSASDVPTTARIDGIDVARLDIGPYAAATLRSGRSLQASDATANVAVLDSRYAAGQQLHAGSMFDVAGTTFIVVGTVDQAAGSGAADIYLPLLAAQQLGRDRDGHSLKGKVSAIYVSASAAGDVGSVEAEIAAVVPSANLTSSQQLADAVSGSLASATTLSQRLGTWLTVGVLLASAAATVLLTLAAVSRRTRELGTLKAIGWGGGRIVELVVVESAVVGLIGAGLGVVIGYVALDVVNAVMPALSASVGAVGTSAGDSKHNVSIHINPHAAVGTVAVATLLAVTMALIAGALAAWRAAQLRPATALADVD
jgi:putative ABC transport system permease protein